MTYKKPDAWYVEYSLLGEEGYCITTEDHMDIDRIIHEASDEERLDEVVIFPMYRGGEISREEFYENWQKYKE